MADEALQSVLQSAGYRVLFREHQWVDCLVCSGEERWTGQGETKGAALDNALARAFPSRLAKQLLHAEAARAQGGTPDPVPAAPAPVATAPVVTESVAEPESAPLSTPSTVPSTPSRPASVAGGSTRSYPPPLAPSYFSTRATGRQDAVEQIETLAHRIQDLRTELACCPATRQRLAILAWICEARAQTDIFPDDIEIREGVAAVSRQLTEIGKAYWPGSVTALQLQMQPTDLPRHLIGGAATTWSQAAELAERALHQLEYGDERRGYDSYGWADGSALIPSPMSPDDELAQLVAELESDWGTLERSAEPRHGVDLPTPEQYQAWVRRSRWIRGSVEDADMWARVTGRLRWWSGRRNPAIQAQARELDPGYAPPRAWASMLGISDVRHEAAPYPENLLKNARARAKDHKVVCVGMRRDQQQQQIVKDLLPDADLEWRLADSKLSREMQATIKDGGWQIVLGATGLQSQALDLALSRTCQKLDLPYLRVNRGQPIAILRALSSFAGL